MLFCFRRLGLPILRAIPARTATTARLVRCALALGLRLRRLLLLGLALRLRFPLGLLQTRFALHTLAGRLLSASSSAAARRAGLLGGLLRARGLGFAMGSGADAAIETADITLVRTDLDAVVTAIRISRATLRIIRQNLFWAFAYNVAAIPLAAAGLLNPMIAGAAMAASSVIVVTNSLRLRRAGA